MSSSMGVPVLWGFVSCSLDAAQGIASDFRHLHFTPGTAMDLGGRELPAWTSLYRGEYFFLGIGAGYYIGPFGAFTQFKRCFDYTPSIENAVLKFRHNHPEWSEQKVRRAAAESVSKGIEKRKSKKSKAEYAEPELYTQANEYAQFLVQLSGISEVTLVLDNGREPEGDAAKTLRKNFQSVLASDLQREHILLAREWAPLNVFSS